MSKKRRNGLLSPHKVCVARIDRLVSYWQGREREPPYKHPSGFPSLPEIAAKDKTAPVREKTSALFQRMRSDERMQVVWAALAKLSDDDFDRFLDEMQARRRDAAVWRFLCRQVEELLNDLRDKGRMARALQDFCGETIGTNWNEETKTHTAISLGRAVPGLSDKLKAAHEFFSERERFWVNGIARV